MSQYQIDTPYPRVLSIQSTVVYGYVGNKSSVYGLQSRKIEVDPLMTCQFSNHTGYESWTGLKVDGPTLQRTVKGLESNSLLGQYTHILSGYMAEPSFIQSLAEQVKMTKAARRTFATASSLIQEDPRVLFVCDPVLGDDNQVYVPKMFIKVYQDELIPLADILTPNETELGLLTNRTSPFETLDQVQEACRELHQQGPGLIVITSVNDYPTASSLLSAQNDNTSSPSRENPKLAEYDIIPHSNINQVYTRKSIGYPSPPHSEFAAQSFTTHTKTYDYSLPSCLEDAVQIGMKSQVKLGCLISYKDPESGHISQYYIKLPRFDGDISGTGDLIASLILAHLQQIQPQNQDQSLVDPDLTPESKLPPPFFCTTEQIRDGSVVGDIVECVCRALSTVHIVVRATTIRGLVGKHCTTCPYCLSLQKLNPSHQQTEEVQKLQQDRALMSPKPTPSGLPRAPIVANLMTEPLELWLPATHAEFLQPSCKFTPQKVSK